MELNNYKKWFTRSYDEFIAAHNIGTSQIAKDVCYEKIGGAIRVDVSNGEFFFFKHGVLKIIYISNNALTEKLWREFGNVFDTNAPEKQVRSRAGKTSNQFIFASQGITTSLNGNSVDYIEIYPPCSMQDYLDEIYKEPGLFIR